MTQYKIQYASQFHQIIVDVTEPYKSIDVASIANVAGKGWQARYCKIENYKRILSGPSVGVNQFINRPNGAQLIMAALAEAAQTADA